MFYVYIIKSKIKDMIYAGSTRNLKERLDYHNQGKQFSTKKFKPWSLIYYEAYAKEQLARLREKRLKQHGNAIRELKKRLGLPSTTFDNKVKEKLRSVQRVIREKSSGLTKSGAGFTFIELLLYISIVTIVLTAVIPFAWSIIEGGAKNSNEREVFSQARYLSEIIKYEIRNATGINSVSSTSISLAKSISADNPTIIDLSSGKVRIKKGTNPAVNLNSNSTSVTSLTFSDYSSSDNKTKHIQFIFTIDDAYTGTRQEYNVPPVNIESSAEVRSN